MLIETISNRLRQRGFVVTRTFIGIVLVIFMLQVGCSSGAPPLAIRLYNPTTNQTLHCTASDKRGENADVLARTVEACARQLEANGFVRDK